VHFSLHWRLHATQHFYYRGQKAKHNEPDDLLVVGCVEESWKRPFLWFKSEAAGA
jgi:hypothetical protein